MTPHQLFGLTKYFTQDELKKKYNHLVQTHHPDKGGDADTFVQIQKAYEELKRLPIRKETIVLSFYTTDKELVDILGKTVILEYEEISFEVFIPHRTRIGYTVKVKNILENVNLSLKIKDKND